ncbi:MAG: hypothetical protein R2942_14885 [Ignavibacteria bacterium]
MKKFTGHFIKHPLKGLAPLGCAYANLGETEKPWTVFANWNNCRLKNPKLY